MGTVCINTYWKTFLDASCDICKQPPLNGLFSLEIVGEKGEIQFKNWKIAKIKFWGDRRQYFGGSIIRQISEGFGSIKEIILYKKQNFFSNNLKLFAERKAKS